jgi:hypothetical protein
MASTSGSIAVTSWRFVSVTWNRKRNPLSICNEMVFCPLFAAIRGVRPQLRRAYPILRFSGAIRFESLSKWALHNVNCDAVTRTAGVGVKDLGFKSGPGTGGGNC